MKVSIRSLYLFLFPFVCYALPGPQQQWRYPGEEAYLKSATAKSTLTYNDTCLFSDENRAYWDDPGEYCNGTKGLDCTSDDGTCGCTNGESLGMQLKTIWVENSCWFTPGSNCYPKIPPRAFKTEIPDLRCKETSECMIKGSTTRKCTLETMQEKVLEEYGGLEAFHKDRQGYSTFAMKRILEGVCACSSAAGIESNLSHVVLFVASLLNLYLT